MVHRERRLSLSQSLVVLVALCGVVRAAPVHRPNGPAQQRPELDTREGRAKTAPVQPQSNTSDGDHDTKQSKRGDVAPDADSKLRSTTSEQGQSSSASDSLPSVDERLCVCDWIYLRTKKDPIKVLLQAIRMDELAPKSQYTFLRYQTPLSDNVTNTLTVQGQDIKEIRYYEQRVVTAAAKELAVAEEKIIRHGRGFELLDTQNEPSLQQAMKVLRTGIEEHDSAVQRKLRSPRMAALLRVPLLEALYNLELGRLDQSIRRTLYVDAMYRCDELRKQFKEVDPTGQALIGRYENICVAQATRAFEQGHFSDARDWIAQLEQRLESPQNVKATEFHHMLMQRASDQVKLAVASKANGDGDAAAQHLERAKEIWPELQSIDDCQRQWDKDYPILHCAYLNLPHNFAPFAVRTPVERHASSLIFESLVRWTNTSTIGPNYRPLLAEQCPGTLTLGRQFRLRRCEWCDPEQKGDIRHSFSSEDVVWTEKLQRENPWARQQIALMDHTSQHGDPFHVDVALTMDHWQPLSFMDFAILPKYRFPPGQPESDELRRLNNHPAGTGPYYLAERKQDSVTFRCNPRFRDGAPLIKEIHFDRLDPARSVAEFINGRVDLIYGLSKAQRGQLRQAVGQKAIVPLNERSIYFLAPNYAHPNTPLRDTNCRLAIAHAIDRAEILNQYFREDEQDPANQPLTGPFPKDSWAYNSDSTTIPPFKVDSAKSYLRLAREALGSVRPISLCHPDDPDSEGACRRIQEQLQQIGIEIKRDSVKSSDWYSKIIEKHDFELAYWRHDFLNDAYWVWPLFDPDAKVMGTNFISYAPDPDFTALFGELRQYKRFTTVRTLTHQVHEHIAKNAIVIPLWQLETYLAVSDRLKNVTVDPWVLFGEVHRWSLVPKRP